MCSHYTIYIKIDILQFDWIWQLVYINLKCFFFAIIVGRAVEQIVSFIFLLLFMMIYCLNSSSEVFV